jgi:enoyl-CoA hydratase/carnithine racemase
VGSVDESNDVLYEVRDDIAWMTINRPTVLNALNQNTRDLVAAGCRRFADDGSARVLVLTGTGDRAFSAGADLKELAADGLRAPVIGETMVHLQRTLKVDKPIIAAVNGLAYGAGFLLVQMVDLVVAAEHATFAIPEARVGRGAPWAAPLPWMIGPRAAMELLTTALPMTAQRAYELGLVNKVVPAESLLREAETMARRIADNAPLAVRAAKEMIYRAASLGWEEGLDAADAVWESVYCSADALEGPLAFAEKRKPVWTGT